jgi:uncharacterized membrane protein
MMHYGQAGRPRFLADLETAFDELKLGQLARSGTMAWALVVVFGLLWALAMASSYTFGGFVHIFLAAAVVVFVYQVIGNRRENAFKKGV